MGIRVGRLTALTAGVAALLAAVAAAPALAVVPTVTTGAASAVTSTSATVDGTVDPNGLATTWNVEYGPTTAYGSLTTSSSAGSGTTAVDVSAQLAGLTPGTTYNYRFVAVNATGTTNGPNATFTTPAPPTVTTGAVTVTSTTSATVTGTVDPRGRATTWVVEYGPTTAYGSTTSSRSAGSGSGALDVSVLLTGLTPGQTVHYRIAATNDAGTTRGSDRTFATASPPRATTGAATAVATTTATFTGTVNPTGLDTTWYFDYGTSTSYGLRTAVRSIAAGTANVGVSAAVTGLRAGTTYYYRLVAQSAAGTATGANATVATIGAPDARTGAATSITAAGATLTGSVDARGRATTWYFEYGTTTGYGSRTTSRSVATRVGDQNVSAAVANLRSATLYHFRLVATSDAGTSRGADQVLTTGSPPVPTTGAASVSSVGTVTFTGLVQPNGVPTSWWFEYGSTTGYGNRTSTRSAGNGRVQAAVSESVAGLAGGSTVQFRLVVSSDAGTAVGRNGSVRVGAAPAAATRGVARVTTSSAIATGTVVTNGLVTSWWVEHGRTTAYGSRTATFRLSGSGATPVRALLSGLGQGTIVHYRVVAQNAAGTAVGSDRAFVTARLPRTPAGDIVRCTIIGTTGNDTLRGTPGRDVICGLEGNDVIRSLGGNDVVYGGPGNDRIETAAGNDVVFSGEGNDTLDGGTGNDALDGGAGRDRIIAGPGRDTMVGGSGTNTANGGPGLDCAVTRGGRTTLVSAGVCPKRR